MKALAKNPANRYQCAADMRADLIRAISARPVLAEPALGEDERATILGGSPTTAPTGDSATQVLQPNGDDHQASPEKVGPPPATAHRVAATG